jgi:xanthine dehydrogenase molybdenum-binding subunit
VATYTLKINGETATFDEDLPVTLLEALRSRQQITSPKDGCSPQGVCGCCTVLVNGKAQMACRKNLDDVDGAEVHTLEGLSDREREVLSSSFVATGGLQCGYCIPGIMMRAKDCLDKYGEPSRDQIKKSLNSHICRCTGYEKILDAVQLAGKHWKGSSLPVIDGGSGVGDRNPRYRGVETALGLKPYVDDVFVDGMLFGATLFSEHPRAKVLKIDTSAAEAMDGVECVVTAADVPGERVQGLIEKDWPVFIAEGEVTHCIGSQLASVAARTREIAREAVKAIVVEYEVLDPVTDPRDALKDGAPEVHAGRSNHLRTCIVRRGDIDDAFAKSAHIFEETFHTQRIDQAFLEPEASVAIPKADGGFEILTQGQGVHDDQTQLASVLGVDTSMVRVKLLSNGGGFGGKEDLAVQAQTLLLAKKSGKPVKLTVTRDQSAVLHPKRHPIDLDYKVGVDEDGKLLAIQARIIGDTGAYASVGDKVLERAAGHSCGPYSVGAVDVVAETVYTNNIPCGAMRGFGANQAAFAVEGMMDRIAEKVGCDAYEIRERNLLTVGDKFSTGQIMTESLGIKETLEAVKDDYYEAKNAGKAVGLGCGIKNTGIGNGMPDIGRVAIEVRGDGSLYLTTGYTEMGQGYFTVLRQVVHEETGLPVEKMDVECLSDEAVVCGMTTASRATMLGSEAAFRAATKLKEALDGAGGDVAKLEGQKFQGEFICDFTTKPGAETDNPVTHVAFSHATQVVILDDAGKLERVVAAHDVGKVMNRTTCEGQIEGSVHMGLGYALTEDLECKDGFVVSTNFADRQILRATHTPKIDVKLIEVPDTATHHGAKGVGEIGLVPTAGAVAAALKVHDGIWRVKLPMRGSAAARAVLPKRLREEDHA